LCPSAGLDFLAATGWREHYPELEALEQTVQDPEWHPEGNVWIHTRMACDALVQLPGWQTAAVEARTVYMLAVLTHDLGKPCTTQTVLRQGRPRTVSPGHESAGVELVESFLERINAPGAIRERVLPLVANHMAAFDAVTDRSIRRLARRLAPETIGGLCLVLRADQAGRPDRSGPGGSVVAAIEAKAHELELQARAPLPLVQGRHLIAWGLTPGRAFGPILQAAFEAQLEGAFSDLEGARRWFSQHQEWHG